MRHEKYLFSIKNPHIDAAQKIFIVHEGNNWGRCINDFRTYLTRNNC